MSGTPAQEVENSFGALCHWAELSETHFPALSKHPAAREEELRAFLHASLWDCVTAKNQESQELRKLEQKGEGASEAW